MVHGLGGAGFVAGDHRQSVGEGLGDGIGEAVAVAFGVNDAGVPKNVGLGVAFADLGDGLGAEECDVGGEAGGVDLLLEGDPEGAVAGDF